MKAALSLWVTGTQEQEHRQAPGRSGCLERCSRDVCGQGHPKCPRDLSQICSVGSPETCKGSEGDRPRQGPSRERAGCFGGTQRTGLASRTKEPPVHPSPKPGGLSPGPTSATQPLLPASGRAAKPPRLGTAGEPHGSASQTRRWSTWSAPWAGCKPCCSCIWKPPGGTRESSTGSCSPVSCWQARRM